MIGLETLSIQLESSLVTAVEVNKWGSEVVLSYLYDPDGLCKRYRLVYENCSMLRWDIYSQEDVIEAERDSLVAVIGYEIPSHDRDHALLVTDTFELAVWYGSCTVTEDHQEGRDEPGPDILTSSGEAS